MMYPHQQKDLDWLTGEARKRERDEIPYFL